MGILNKTSFLRARKKNLNGFTRQSFLKKNLGGFTLIELLVVLAIIALLAAIVFVFLSQARASARDTERRAEIDAIRKALAVYEAEHGKYPEVSTWASLEDDPLMDTGKTFTQEMGDFLPELPKDPLWGQEKEPGKPYSYQYTTSDTGGADYKLHVEMETGEYAYYEQYSTGGVGIEYGGEEAWSLTESNCNALDGWYWYTTAGRSACWSKELGDHISWNKGVGQDSDNPGAYTCSTSIPALRDRMVAVAAGEWHKIVSNIAGTDITPSHNGSAGYSRISALAITDCTDGVRDLCTGDGCLGGSVDAVNTSLRAWASATGNKSALPYCPGTDNNCYSTDGYNDYYTACNQYLSNDLPLDCSEGLFYKNKKVCGDVDENYSWVALASNEIGARAVGRNGCGSQTGKSTSDTEERCGFRAVIRP